MGDITTQIAVVGPGAVGTTVAALLHAAGHRLVLCGRTAREQVEQVQPHCPLSTVVPGIVWYSAESQRQGWVRLRGQASLVLPTGPAAETIAELLRGAGCAVNCDPDFLTAA